MLTNDVEKTVRGRPVQPERVLTGAGEALLAHSDEHIQAEITVGRLIEVFQSPHMLPIILHILQRV